MSEPLHDPVDETTRRQRLAATPDLSAWVSANAGSGKTHVLANRVIRLLLSGVRPSAILCLTYTKAAAAEMSNRVFRILGAWTRLSDEELAAAIEALEGRRPLAADLSRARQLFAMALETPGGLKIQTIHGFCEAVLHRFPLEANIAGNFSVLDDTASANLLAQARRALFAAGEEDGEMAAALEAVLDMAGETGLEKLLDEVYAGRREIMAFFAGMEREGNVEAGLRRGLGIAREETRADIENRLWPLATLPRSYLQALHEAASGPKPMKTALDFAAALLAAGQEDDPALRRDMLRDAFFTKGGDLRSLSNVAVAGIRAVLPDIAERLEAVKADVEAAFRALDAHDALDASRAALRVAHRYIAGFEALKRRQALLDFDDLIALTEALLRRSGASAWVHYKLDQGIDHILVDEAQDTAPLQWSVIRALAAEFFAGSGARPGIRTVFSVGDEKQSIYSFQGARPERFSEERRGIARQAAEAGRTFEDVSLRVSFRSTREVLSLVDLVYAQPAAQGGMGEDRAAILHESARLRAPGCVELWDVIAAEKTPDSDSWTDPFDKVPETAPAARLARRIAATLKGWIGGERIHDARTGESRLIRPGDVLVLVRKRDGFVPTLLRMLKAQGGIPVAGADRLRLTDHIAVQDMMALGRFALLEDDDLALAGLVKSPLSGLTEDDLYRLADRPEDMSLADHLDLLSATEPGFARLSELARHWRALARRVSVHDFYATILGPEGGREAYLARLGSEVGDVLDEFLALALDHDEAGIPGLQSFISMLETDAPEIKREMEQGSDAVRVMTVHAAKGLEAPVVFLVDQGGEAFQASHLPALWFLPSGRGEADPKVPVWLPRKEMRAIPAAGPAVAKARQEAEDEYRRLLYVGLTRAADRLVVCGYRGVRAASGPTWHSLVSAGFEAAERHPDFEVSNIGRGAGEEAFTAKVLTLPRPPEPEPAENTPAGQPAAPPSFLCPDEPLPPPRRLPRPLVPSGSGASLTRDEEAPTFASPFATRGSSERALHMERGRAAHRLLQVLPGLPPEEREAAALRYVARALPDFPDAVRARLVAEIMTILADPAFAGVFGGTSATEVSIMGMLRLGAEERVVSGRIDRMAVFDDHVLILDYKTGQLAPDGGHHPDHAAQLAVYRAVLQPLYPGRDIRAALLYTALPRLIYLDPKELDAALAALSSR
jgi:double-strand break repair helicase AddA, alphaproteobacterial type